MKRKGFITAPLILLLFTAGAALFSISNAQEKVYHIGDKGPGDGWVFYDKGSYSDGWRYLEVAPDDIGNVAWGCQGVSIPGAKGTAVGTGKTNTEAMLKGCSDKLSAAKMVKSYQRGRKKDWFIPSKDEILLIFQNVAEKGLYNFGMSWGWSSTEANPGAALKFGFVTGKFIEERKTVSSGLYPVRAF